MPATNFCGSCGSGVDPQNRFCPACGTPTQHTVDQLAAAAAAPASGPRWADGPGFEPSPEPRAADQMTGSPLTGFDFQPDEHNDEPAEAAPHGRSRAGLWVAGSLAAAVIAALGILAFFALRGPSAEETAIAAAEATTLDLLADLSEAESTADLRAVAEGSVSSAEKLTAAVEAAPADSGSLPAMNAYSDLLTALGALASIDGDNLSVWDEASGDILDAAESVTATRPDSDEPTVAALAEDSVESAGGMVAEAVVVMDEWRAVEAEILERNVSHQETRAELDSYAPQVESILSRYATERTATSRFMDQVRTEGATVREAYNEFQDGETARLDLAYELRSLNYPDGMASEHDRLVGMIEAGASAMAAGYRGVEEYVDYYYFIPYDETPGHIRFQEESDRISAEFGTAETSWQSALERAYAAAQDEPVPAKPVV